MKDHTTLSLRLTADERELLEALKAYLCEPVASRALKTVIHLYPAQHQALQRTLDELDRVRADRDRLLQAIAAAEQGRLDLIHAAAEIAGAEDYPANEDPADLLRDPANAGRLLGSVGELEAGKGTEPD